MMVQDTTERISLMTKQTRRFHTQGIHRILTRKSITSQRCITNTREHPQPEQPRSPLRSEKNEDERHPAAGCVTLAAVGDIRACVTVARTSACRPGF